MAIEAPYADDFGVRHPSAYHRVAVVRILRTEGPSLRTFAQVVVQVFHDKATRDNLARGLRAITTLEYEATEHDPGPEDNFGTHFGGTARQRPTRDPSDGLVKAAYAFIKAQGLTGRDV